MVLEVGDSKQFVYDKRTEIDERVRDFNERSPTAEIFNEGIGLTTESNISVEYDIEVELLSATLPSNIFGYDMSRTYTNEADHIVPNDGFIYIDEIDYIALFDPAEDTPYATQADDELITQGGDTLILD